MCTFFTAWEVLERHRLHTSLSRRARRTSGTPFSILGLGCVWYSYCPLRFSETLFIDASTEATTVASLESIALLKGVGSTAGDTLNWLQAEKREWMLLFNNADDKTLKLHNFFPSCGHGNILITSRNAGCRVHAPGTNQEVSGMTASEAQDLLLNDIQRDRNDEAEVQKMAADIVSVCSIMDSWLGCDSDRRPTECRSLGTLRSRSFMPGRTSRSAALWAPFSRNIARPRCPS